MGAYQDATEDSAGVRKLAIVLGCYAISGIVAALWTGAVWMAKLVGLGTLLGDIFLAPLQFFPWAMGCLLGMTAGLIWPKPLPVLLGCAAAGWWVVIGISMSGLRVT